MTRSLRYIAGLGFAALAINSAWHHDMPGLVIGYIGLMVVFPLFRWEYRDY